MREFRSVKKDWMANQSDDEKIMKQIFDTADWMTNRVEQMQQDTATAQAKLEETYTKAMQIAGP
jgi:hypothetical protein